MPFCSSTDRATCLDIYLYTYALHFLQARILPDIDSWMFHPNLYSLHTVDTSSCLWHIRCRLQTATCKNWIVINWMENMKKSRVSEDSLPFYGKCLLYKIIFIFLYTWKNNNNVCYLYSKFKHVYFVSKVIYNLESHSVHHETSNNNKGSGGLMDKVSVS